MIKSVNLNEKTKSRKVELFLSELQITFMICSPRKRIKIFNNKSIDKHHQGQ
jgi:hypothetical protein